MDRCVFPVPTPPTNTTLEASATKRQSKTCRVASRSRSGCASNEKASSVFSIGKRASWMRRWMRRSRRPVTSKVHQLRQVVGRRLSLAGGLLGEQPPLRPDRRQAQRLQVRRQMRGLDNRGRHQQEPSTSASYADSVGVGTAIRASSGRTPATGGHTGGGPACC